MTRLPGLSRVTLRGQEFGGFLMNFFSNFLMFIRLSKCLMHGKTVDRVRPTRRRSGFKPKLESIEEAEEEENKTEDESTLEGTEDGENKDEKMEEEKNDKEKEEDNQRGKEGSKKRWNDEVADQGVVLTAITIQNNASEPFNVEPEWGRGIATRKVVVATAFDDICEGCGYDS
ncbi:unnamed protein product [Dibothriocephalus latus]|uniref:Uncharacterized protein n=1 Tax=Dibothriocephalus latus TaxID=60516 RepID=A0A3P6Q033_DIBLA|nr:unnamed protein product [Dibothriocephalus latus]